MGLILLLRSSLFLAIAAVAGCVVAPDPWGCADQTCRETTMLTAWQTEPGDAVEQLALLPDSLDRITTISAIIDHYPGETGALCEMLPHGMSKERCLAVNANPDIWNRASEPFSRGSRAGPGPATSAWSAIDFETSDLINQRGNSRICADEVDPHACVWGWSRVHAMAGDIDDVAELCASVRTSAPSPNRWRHACFLSSAELHVSVWGRTGLADSVRLCGASGDFKAVCAAQLVRHLASLAPPSDMSGGRAWSDHLMRAQAIRQAWKDSPMLPELNDRFWAQSMAASTAKAHGLSGDAFDVLPSAAKPHIRAAVVWEWMSRFDGHKDFSGLMEALSVVLALRLDRKALPVEEGQIPTMMDLWPTDREGEAHLSAVSYFGTSRRTVARDPSIDIGLCVLEAAARLESPAHGVIKAGLRSSDERIRWTAARLLEQLEARRLGAAVMPVPHQAPEPAVPIPSL